MKLSKLVVVLALSSASLTAHAVPNSCGAPELPPALRSAPLRAPVSEQVAFVVAAEGTQNYVCGAAADGKLGWQFTGPRATLYGPNHEVLGTHFKDAKGPAWQFTGGDKIVGRKVSEAAAPLSNAGSVNIPLLLLEKVDGQGTGPFSRFTYIQRGDTEGGVPSKAYDLCDASKVGQTLEVEYRANYYFYEATKDGHKLSCRYEPKAEVAPVETVISNAAVAAN